MNDGIILRAPCYAARLFVEQVEIDTPTGESLAFVLQHGEDVEAAVVRFCRANRISLPDEDDCISRLAHEVV